MFRKCFIVMLTFRGAEVLCMWSDHHHQVRKYRKLWDEVGGGTGREDQLVIQLDCKYLGDKMARVIGGDL